MADQVDGSIVIDTKLDNKGFQKGSDDLMKALSRLEESINMIGDTLSDGLSSVIKSLNALQSQSTNTYQGMKSDAESAAAATDEVAKSAERAKTATQGISITPVGVEQQESYIPKNFAYGEGIPQIDKAVDSLDTKIQRLQLRMEQGFKNPEALDKFLIDVDAVEKQVDVLAEKMTALGDVGTTTPEYDQLNAELEAAKAELDALVQKENELIELGANFGGVWDDLIMKEADAGDKIYDIQTKMEALENAGKAYTYNSDNADWQNSQAGVEALQNSLNEIHENVNNAAATADTSGLQKVQRETKKTIPYSSFLRDSFKTALGSIAADAKSAAINLAGMAKNGIQTGIKKLGTRFQELSKKSNSTSVSLAGGLKKVLAYGFGIRSMFVLFRKLRTNLAAGLEDYEKYDRQFMQTVGNFKAALTTLQHSFASAFAPIVSAALPPLTTLINAMSEAISKVGQLIAALSGQSSYKKAAAVQYSAADAAAEAADSLNDEAASAKKAQKSLAGFDDVQILTDNSSPSSGSGKKTGGMSGGGYEDVPIENSIGDLAQMIKDAWKDADFTGIGRMIGDKLNEALKSIPWGKIKVTLKKIAKSIATLLNGFLETPGLFDEIGYTIAQGINSAFLFVESFVSNFHWGSLGQAIQDLILGTLNNIDWPLIYKTMKELGAGIGTALETALDNQEIWTAIFVSISNGMNAVVYGVQTFLDSINWLSLGKNIAAGLNRGINAINWTAIGKLLSTGFNSALNIWYGFISTFNFYNFGYKVASGISYAIQHINWSQFGSNMSISLNGLSSTLEGLVDGINWDGIGQAVADFIVGFFDKKDWGQDARTLSKFLRGINTAFLKLIQTIPWSKIPHYITKSISDFMENFDWEGMVNDTIGILNSAVQALIDMLQDGDDTKTSPLITALGNLKTTISEIDPQMFSDLATGIKDVVTALAPVADGFGAGFVEFFNGLLSIGIAFFKALGPALSAIADALNKVDPETLESIGEVLGKIAAAFITINAFKGVLDTLKKLTTVIGGFASACSAAAGGITAFLIALDQFKIKAGEGEDEVMNLNHSFSAIKDTLKLVQQEYDLTDDQMNTLYETILKSVGNNGSLKDSYGDIDAILEAAGINVDDFKQKLATSAETYRNTGADLSELDGYIASVGENSESADGKTGSLKDAISRFGGVSWSEALKIAVLSGAFKTLSDNGQLSKEDTENLQAALDDYDPSKPEASMKRIYDAFEKSGIKASDFSSAVVGAMADVDDDMKPEIESVEGQIGDMGVYLLTGGKTAGGNIGKGLQEGAKAQEKDTKKAMWMFMASSLLSLNNAADIGSPSKKTRQTGIYLGQGLVNGLNSTASNVSTAAKKIVQDVIDVADGHDNEMKSAGSRMMSGLGSGVSGSYRYVVGCAESIASGMKNEFDMYNSFKVLGGNIGIGIYNGLIAKSGTLNSLAWNTAVDMYNSACRALGIHSPSRKFAYIGTMLTAGLAEGVESTEKTATGAVTSLADAVGKTAEKENPIMQLTAGTTGLDNALNNFSDKVTSKFADMISAMGHIASGASFIVPNVATGSVTPYSARRTAPTSQADTSADLVSAMQRAAASGISRDDLTDVLSSVLSQYLNIQLYIGDEQIARHANRGNMKLSRRYNPAG